MSPPPPPRRERSLRLGTRVVSRLNAPGTGSGDVLVSFKENAAAAQGRGGVKGNSAEDGGKGMTSKVDVGVDAVKVEMQVEGGEVEEIVIKMITGVLAALPQRETQTHSYKDEEGELDKVEEVVKSMVNGVLDLLPQLETQTDKQSDQSLESHSDAVQVPPFFCSSLCPSRCFSFSTHVHVRSRVRVCLCTH